jgi:hypothetical protein
LAPVRETPGPTGGFILAAADDGADNGTRWPRLESGCRYTKGLSVRRARGILLALSAAAWGVRPPALFADAAPAAAGPSTPSADPSATVAAKPHPFLAKYRVTCHGPQKPKKGLRLDLLASSFDECRGDPQLLILSVRVSRKDAA